MSVVSKTRAMRPDWANVPIRMDPALADRRQVFEMMEGEELVGYRIDRRGAVVRRRLKNSGVPVSMALGPRAFLGVAARALDDGEGNVTVTLELHHADPRLSVPLLVASDLFDVAADWRGWSELFGLTMLMIESDGSVTSLEETLGRIRTGGEASPRHRPVGRNRRPRFLARRKPGGLGIRMIVSGEEIIARR